MFDRCESAEACELIPCFGNTRKARNCIIIATNRMLSSIQIAALFEEAALKFVRLALACCHEKRRERPKMSDTLAQLNEIERMVAVANGREPEESLPPPVGMTS